MGGEWAERKRLPFLFSLPVQRGFPFLFVSWFHLGLKRKVAGLGIQLPKVKAKRSATKTVRKGSFVFSKLLFGALESAQQTSGFCNSWLVGLPGQCLNRESYLASICLGFSCVSHRSGHLESMLTCINEYFKIVRLLSFAYHRFKVCSWTMVVPLVSMKYS